MGHGVAEGREVRVGPAEPLHHHLTFERDAEEGVVLEETVPLVFRGRPQRGHHREQPEVKGRRLGGEDDRQLTWPPLDAVEEAVGRECLHPRLRRKVQLAASPQVRPGDVQRPGVGPLVPGGFGRPQPQAAGSGRGDGEPVERLGLTRGAAQEGHAQLMIQCHRLVEAGPGGGGRLGDAPGELDRHIGDAALESSGVLPPGHPLPQVPLVLLEAGDHGADRGPARVHRMEGRGSLGQVGHHRVASSGAHVQPPFDRVDRPLEGGCLLRGRGLALDEEPFQPAP